MGRQVTYTIPLSASVGSPVDTRQFTKGIGAVNIPALTSGDLFVQTAMGSGSIPPSSAEFVRVMDYRVTSGYLKFATGPGSAWLSFPPDFMLGAWTRLEVSVAQGAARDFTIQLKN